MCVCVVGGGDNAYRARRLSHNGTFQLRRTRRAATRRTAQISRHLPHIGWPESGWMLSVACCMLHVACRPSLVACCMLPPEQAVSARTHARAQRARADALVGMAVADEAVGRKASVALRAHSALATAAAAHTVHSSCTASIAAEQRRLAASTDRGRRHREGAPGRRDGGAPGRLVHRAAASLQGTPQRRRWALAVRMLNRACCALPASICSQLSRLTLSLVLRCLFVCLFVCLRLALAKHTVDGAAYAPHAPSIRGLLRSVCSGLRCSSP